MKQSVVLIPFRGDMILLQLRDNNPEIPHPGCWAFFSGSIEPGELPEDAGRRELREELGIACEAFISLGTYRLNDPAPVIIHCFSFPLLNSLETITLNEGLDFGLFPISQVRSGRLFSPRLQAYYPVVDLPVVDTLLTCSCP